MKKALILGVGGAQVDAIRYLKAAGWWVIGCSYRQEGSGLPWVDQFELVDIKDAAGVEGLARRESVNLVYSVGSDLAMITAARVSERLGLPTLATLEVAELMQNKLLLRGFLNKRGISPVAYRWVRSEADLDGWEIFPAMVKPADCQGQRGVFRADSMEEIRAGLGLALHFSQCRAVIVEEYLEGPEISVNTFVHGGRMVFAAISDRLILPEYPGGLIRGHILPARQCPPAMEPGVRALVAEALSALEIQNGPIYFQVKCTAQGPRIIEITPRLDGCHLWRLIAMVGGGDLLAATFRLLEGDGPATLNPVALEGYRHLGFFLAPPGRVFRKEEHRAPAGADFVEYYYRDGDVVPTSNGYMEKVGYYIHKECYGTDFLDPL